MVSVFFCVAHCLHTVTEENTELVRSVNAAVFAVLENILSSTHTSMEYTLLRTLAAGKRTYDTGRVLIFFTKSTTSILNCLQHATSSFFLSFFLSFSIFIYHVFIVNFFK